MWRRESTNITDSLVFFIHFWLEACFRLISPGPSFLRERPTLFTHFSKFLEVTHNFLRLKYHEIKISQCWNLHNIEISRDWNLTILKSPQYWNLHNIEISQHWNITRLKSPQYVVIFNFHTCPASLETSLMRAKTLQFKSRWTCEEEEEGNINDKVWL